MGFDILNSLNLCIIQICVCIYILRHTHTHTKLRRRRSRRRSGCSVNHRNLSTIDKNTSTTRVITTSVIFGSRKHGKHTSSFGYMNPIFAGVAGKASFWEKLNFASRDRLTVQLGPAIRHSQECLSILGLRRFARLAEFFGSGLARCFGSNPSI